MIDRIENTCYNRVEFRLNGELHNPSGPALIYNDKNLYWYLFGERHRYYGPRESWNQLGWVIHGRRII